MSLDVYLKMPSSSNELEETPIAEALKRMRAENERAEAARVAFRSTPWWRLWRRHTTWQEFVTAVKAGRTFEQQLADVESDRSRIFVRRNGATEEISREEWDALYPDREPVVAMISESNGEVFSKNITHNLGTMAKEAGCYEAMWRPDEHGMTHARDLIVPLRDGLAALQSDPEHFKQFNPENGWGDYDGLVAFVADYLGACERWPNAQVETWR